MKYKYLNRFQAIYCAECESSDQLSISEYTDDVLCLTCLNGFIEESESELTKKEIDEIRGDELRQRMRDEK